MSSTRPGNNDGDSIIDHAVCAHEWVQIYAARLRHMRDIAERLRRERDEYREKAVTFAKMTCYSEISTHNKEAQQFLNAEREKEQV